MIRLRDLPFDLIRLIYRRIRKALFTKDRGEGNPYLIDNCLDEVASELGKYSFAPNWEFSYNYRGEDLNLAQVVYCNETEHPRVHWWQTHVRGYVTDQGVELEAHWEAEPTEFPEEHLEGEGTEVEKGEEILGCYLDKSDLDIKEDPR